MESSGAANRNGGAGSSASSPKDRAAADPAPFLFRHALFAPRAPSLEPTKPGAKSNGAVPMDLDAPLIQPGRVQDDPDSADGGGRRGEGDAADGNSDAKAYPNSHPTMAAANQASIVRLEKLGEQPDDGDAMQIEASTLGSTERLEAYAEPSAVDAAATTTLDHGHAIDPAEEMKSHKLARLCQGGYPSFVRLLTANYDTDADTSDSDQYVDSDFAQHESKAAAQNSQDSDFVRHQKSLTIDVDVYLGLKSPQEARRQRRRRPAGATASRRSHRARDDDDDDQHPHHSAALDEGYYSGYVNMSLREDAQYLNELHCWIRSNLEFFSATMNDVKRKPTLTVGKVGVRCIHCRKARDTASNQAPRKSSWSTAPGFISYPANIAAIFNICQQKPATHWESCPNLPVQEAALLKGLLLETSTSKRPRRDLPASHYYSISAKRIGIVNHEVSGIRFSRDLKLSPLSLELCRKQFETETASSTLDDGTFQNGSVVSVEPRLTANPEAEAVLAQALLEPDQPEQNLSRSSDKSKVTDYIFLVIRQMQICHVEPLDFNSRGKRAQGLRLGMTGFCCRHCHAQRQDPLASCRCFSSAADNLSSSIGQTFVGHLVKCPFVSPELRSALQAYKRLHARQLAQLPHGSQRRLIHELWTRMRDADVSVQDDNHRMESPPETKPTASIELDATEAPRSTNETSKLSENNPDEMVN